MPYDICEDEQTLDYIESEMAKRGITQELIDETRAQTEMWMLDDMRKLASAGGDLNYRDENGATPVCGPQGRVLSLSRPFILFFSFVLLSPLLSALFSLFPVFLFHYLFLTLLYHFFFFHILSFPLNLASHCVKTSAILFSFYYFFLSILCAFTLIAFP